MIKWGDCLKWWWNGVITMKSSAHIANRSFFFPQHDQSSTDFQHFLALPLSWNSQLLHYLLQCLCLTSPWFTAEYEISICFALLPPTPVQFTISWANQRWFRGKSTSPYWYGRCGFAWWHFHSFPDWLHPYSGFWSPLPCLWSSLECREQLVSAANSTI